MQSGRALLLRERTDLRVLFLLDGTEAVTIGGTERQVLRAARALHRAGHQPEIFLLRGENFAAAENIPVRSFRYKGLKSVSSWKELRRLHAAMKIGKFDVVCTYFVEANMLGPPLARMTGAKLVIGNRRNENHWMSFSARILQRWSNHYSDRLLGNSERVRKSVAALEGLDAAKMDVLYNGVDVARFAASAERRKEVRGRLGLNSKIAVGVTATLRPVKGIDVLIGAAAEVCAAEKNAIFLIAGDGTERAKLESLARELGIQGSVLFMGGEQDIPSFLSALDIAVLPSRAEGFSNALLEYMAAGLPIVASDVGGNAEAVGTTGTLVRAESVQELASAILKLAKNPAMREQLGRHALNRVVQKFDSKRADEEFVHYLENAFAHRSGARAEAKRA